MKNISEQERLNHLMARFLRLDEGGVPEARRAVGRGETSPLLNISMRVYPVHWQGACFLV
jgi:hypothetical protein